MTTNIEKLLVPRYIVILDYPHNIFGVNEIIPMKYLENFREWAYEDCTRTMMSSFLDTHPKIFRRLEWWEEVPLDEMPQYVKLEIEGKIGYVHKVEQWVGENMNGQPLYEYLNRLNFLCGACIVAMLPATQQEYSDWQRHN